MSYISANLNLLMAVVKKAGNGLSRDFSEIEQLQTSIKGHKEFTQAAYERTLKILRVELQKSRPQYAVITKGENVPSTSYFLVSPLDGAVNFMHGIAYFAISVAEVVSDEIVASVVYNPATSDMYFAEKGNGSFKEGYRNQERLRVSARKDLGLCVISGSDEYSSAVAATRNMGSISLDLANLASGRFDGLIALSQDRSDIAAGILLVKEAGGRVLAKGQKDVRVSDINFVLSEGNVIASNSEVATKLFNLVK